MLISNTAMIEHGTKQSGYAKLSSANRIGLLRSAELFRRIISIQSNIQCHHMRIEALGRAI